MLDRTKKKLNKKSCRIKNLCIIVTFLLIFSGCENARSIRKANPEIKKTSLPLITKKQDLKPINQNNSNNDVINESDNNESNYVYTSNEDNPDIKIQKSSNKRRIPTLREQMKIYEQEQKIIISRVDNIESDISGIKNTIVQIKQSMIDLNDQYSSSAVTGLPVNLNNVISDDNTKIENTEQDENDYIQPDEKIETKKITLSKRLRNSMRNKPSLVTKSIISA